MEPGLFKAVVSNYLSSAGEGWLIDRRPRRFDFVVETLNGRRVALDVRSAPPPDATLDRLRAELAQGADPVSELVLVTPEPPASAEAHRFRARLTGSSVPHRWIGVNDLPGVLGAASPGDLTAAETISRLQDSALVKSVAAYQAAPSGPLPETRGAQPHAAAPGESPLPASYLSLARQLPFGVVQHLHEQPGELDVKLHLGTRHFATVVLSDLKNFSTLVSASSPDVLNESMARYYRRVRDAVFRHGGMLDKFIGDAALAVFGYPLTSDGDADAAVQFARELIAIGGDILQPWLNDINAVVETGTRVGIATGDVWPLNIGQRELELTLLGDTINLAARLEKHCAVDGVLTDNRTHTRLRHANRTAGAVETHVETSDAKGQTFTVRAWQLRS
jgi:adenylate cyclase